MIELQASEELEHLVLLCHYLPGEGLPRLLLLCQVLLQLCRVVVHIIAIQRFEDFYEEKPLASIKERIKSDLHFLRSLTYLLGYPWVSLS